jgi:hypothetical protein
MKNNIYESSWSQLEKRLNLQSISEFIRHGGDVPEVIKYSFNERISRADKTLQEYFENIRTDKQEEISEKIAEYSNIMQDIYFTMGMKAGAQIIIQLTNNFETDF